MKRSIAASFQTSAAGVTTILLLCICILLLMSGATPAQDLSARNEFVDGRVLSSDGTIFIMIPPARIGFDPLLNFYDKSFFTAKIGGQYFTNNNIITPVPANTKKLGPPNQLITVKGTVDTVRAVWTSRNGVDIIQDIWPIKFTKSGQIMIRWSFRNLDSTAVVPIQCQWLNDLDIADQSAKVGQTANDGPIVLHRYGYYDQWQQYPGAHGSDIPWFYCGFLNTLPGPNNNPGLAGQGYLDFSEIGTTKPTRVTMGDWYTLASTIFGTPPNFSTLNGLKPGKDGAILIEFPAVAASKKHTVVGGITSYGTAEYERCVGNMFGLVFYPHRIDWNKLTASYSPSPFQVELYALDPSQFDPAGGSRFTLTTCPNLVVTNQVGNVDVGRSQTLPADTNGMLIAPGAVGVFDWWVKATPALYCTGDVQTCFKFSGTTALGPPTYTSVIGDTCLLPITIGCAETDTLPPIHNTVTHPQFGLNDSIWVHDDRADDKGLKSISWRLVVDGPASNFVIDTLNPIQACYNDKGKHLIVIRQIDSLIAGCFEFLFQDCLGNTSDTTVCFPKHIFIPRDTLAPAYTNVWTTDSMTVDVNVQDARYTDRGLDTITWSFSSPSAQQNITMSLTPPIVPCQGDTNRHIVKAQQTLPTPGESVYLVFRDCVGNQSFDTIVFPGPLSAVTDEPFAKELAITDVQPNPFAASTTIVFALPRMAHVRLEIFDIAGKPLGALVDQMLSAGRHSVRYESGGLASGSYILRLNDGSTTVSRRIEIRR